MVTMGGVGSDGGVGISLPWRGSVRFTEVTLKFQHKYSQVIQSFALRERHGSDRGLY
jgi:hypothetical protein